MKRNLSETTQQHGMPRVLGDAPCESEDLTRLMRGQRNTAPAPAQLFVGTVVEPVQANAALCVLGPHGNMPALLAASCLLLPHVGDLVQVLTDAQGCWVVCVLQQRDAQAPRTLQLGPGDVHMQAQTLHLQARDLHLQADTLQESAQRRQSDIQGWSTMRAAFVDVHAQRQLKLFGNVTTLLADALLKVDGAQIHMG